MKLIPLFLRSKLVPIVSAVVFISCFYALIHIPNFDAFEIHTAWQNVQVTVLLVVIIASISLILIWLNQEPLALDEKLKINQRVKQPAKINFKVTFSEERNVPEKKPEFEHA